jgi:hypothetical protein
MEKHENSSGQGLHRRMPALQMVAQIPKILHRIIRLGVVIRLPGSGGWQPWPGAGGAHSGRGHYLGTVNDLWQVGGAPPGPGGGTTSWQAILNLIDRQEVRAEVSILFQVHASILSFLTVCAKSASGNDS